MRDWEGTLLDFFPRTRLLSLPLLCLISFSLGVLDCLRLCIETGIFSFPQYITLFPLSVTRIQQGINLAWPWVQSTQNRGSRASSTSQVHPHRLRWISSSDHLTLLLRLCQVWEQRPEQLTLCSPPMSLESAAAKPKAAKLSLCFSTYRRQPPHNPHLLPHSRHTTRQSPIMGSGRTRATPFLAVFGQKPNTHELADA